VEVRGLAAPGSVAVVQPDDGGGNAPAEYTIGVTVTGLDGDTVTLENNTARSKRRGERMKPSAFPATPAARSPTTMW